MTKDRALRRPPLPRTDVLYEIMHNQEVMLVRLYTCLISKITRWIRTNLELRINPKYLTTLIPVRIGSAQPQTARIDFLTDGFWRPKKCISYTSRGLINLYNVYFKHFSILYISNKIQERIISDTCSVKSAKSAIAATLSLYLK